MNKERTYIRPERGGMDRARSRGNTSCRRPNLRRGLQKALCSLISTFCQKKEKKNGGPLNGKDHMKRVADARENGNLTCDLNLRCPFDQSALGIPAWPVSACLPGRELSCSCHQLSPRTPALPFDVGHPRMMPAGGPTPTALLQDTSLPGSHLLLEAAPPPRRVEAWSLSSGAAVTQPESQAFQR